MLMKAFVDEPTMHHLGEGGLMGWGTCRESCLTVCVEGG